MAKNSFSGEWRLGAGDLRAQTDFIIEDLAGKIHPPTGGGRGKAVAECIQIAV
ncbi:hypothetical protein HMPREF0262_02159 [Clostridium sp. ATCC 29733]|nr:hypothetical protein HMPREF0262_02159 [Clostridium sp. ATCC 29733]